VEVLMEIMITKIGDINLVRLSGIMDSEASAIVLQTLKPVAKAGGKLLLDMEEVTTVTSAHLVMLVQLYKSLNLIPGTLALLHVNDALRYFFDVAGFSTVIPQYASEEAAIAAMSRLDSQDL
jgi:anti-anti-sigma factor